MSAPRKRMGLGIVLAAAMLCGALGMPTASAHGATLSGDWPMYQGDGQRTGTNLAETIITPATAPYLTNVWKFTTGGPVVASPVIANGVMYVGAWDGYEYAVDLATHQQLWRQNLGMTTNAQTQSNCYGNAVGISSTPFVNQTALYVGGGDGYLYALNLADGSVLWRTFLGAPPYYNWSSPLLYNGRVYVGISAYCDPPGVQGKLFAFNANDGSLAASISLVPDGMLGATVWSSPAVDLATGRIFVTTGNNAHATLTQEPNSEAFLALDSTTMAIVDRWQIPHSDQPSTGDADFGGSPTLFDVNGVGYIGALNKSGIYYVLNRSNLAAGAVWKQALGGTPFAESSRVSTACYDNSVLYVGSGPVNGTSFGGSLTAFDATTGTIVWQADTVGKLFGSVTCVPGLMVDNQGRTVEVRSAATGAILYQFATGAALWGTSIIAHGVLYTPSKDDSVYAFTVQNTNIPQLIFQDNFDEYATGTLPLGPGTSQWSTQTVAGAGFGVNISSAHANSGPNALQFLLGATTGGHTSVRKLYASGSASATHSVRFGLYLDSSLQYSGQAIAVMLTENLQGTTNGSISLHLSPSHALVVVRHNSLGQVINQTLSTKLSLGQWYTMELDQTNNAISGSWSLWLDGIQIGGQTGVDTGSVPINALVAGDALNAANTSLAGSFYEDDVICAAALHIS